MEGKEKAEPVAHWYNRFILKQSILALGVATLQPRLDCFSAIFIQPPTSHIRLSFVTLRFSPSPCSV